MALIFFLILGLIKHDNAFAQEVDHPFPPAQTAWQQEPYDVEKLAFVSAEALQYDTQTGVLKLRVFLDDEGNMSDHSMTVRVNHETEITNGEDTLDPEALYPHADVDVEYQRDDHTATYIFIY